MKRIGSLAIFGVILVLTWTGPAVASCVAPAPLETRLGEARTAFVGTVAATSNRGRNAEVRVEKIWLGERLPPRVEILGGEQRANVSSSVDRTYRSGRRYLFVLDEGEPPFRDDACSATTEFTEEVAALEPEGAIAPRPPGGSGSIAPWVALGIVLLGLGLLQARRASRRAESIEP